MRGHCGVFMMVLFACGTVIYVINDENNNILNGNVKTIQDTIISSSLLESLQLVDRAIKNTIKRSDISSKLPNSIQMLSFLKRAAPESEEVSRAAEIFETTCHIIKKNIYQKHKRSINTTDFLTNDELQNIAAISGCHSHLQPPICQKSCLINKYRTITGACNNRKNLRWGASNTALARWLPAEYEDGFSQPKGWNPGHVYNGFELPSVREVSKALFQSFNQSSTEDSIYSRMLVEWGQYIDHDISFTPQSISKSTFITGVDCRNTCENLNPCFPIKIPVNDSFSALRMCLPFYRSSPACGTGDGDILSDTVKMSNKRQQINGLSSFIDASTVYGGTVSVESKIRNLTNKEGLLNVNKKYQDNGREFLPFVAEVPSPCAQDPLDNNGERTDCFLAGDSRSSEVLSLTTLHTIWLREHNRIAKALKKINNHWSAETVYQETRKIIGALHQIITLRDYVPKIIGSDAFDHYIGKYKAYNPLLDPTVSNVFSTAAFRFGHATVPPVLKRLDNMFEEKQNYSSVRLHEAFFSPWRLIKEGGLDPVIRGILVQPANVIDQDNLMTDELTEKLFVFNATGTFDLASLNLQRGRDHGLPGYNDWREFCGLHRLNTEGDLSTAISNANLIKKLLEIYKHPSNIDVWLGGLVEDILPRGRTGPLFACLIGKQMHALRDGDRFWWENEGIFTESQRSELAKHSLSRVMCDNSGVNEVPGDSFLLSQYPKDFISCDIISSMNLNVWKESNVQVGVCGSPREIENGDYTFCPNSSHEVVSYSCFAGYRLEGHEEITCTKSGWSHDPPVCVGKL
ncbi:thyroid peroxidase [Erpetoichthys calabaricus]|uniref:thyroid peroxidase n=1 Tax=Erpetoichthys calabaricus TaxID=27687 RepID=UPI002233E4A8|nr:thyroid peroxidase [Erpetoichthys calabaricus]